MDSKAVRNSWRDLATGISKNQLLRHLQGYMKNSSIKSILLASALLFSSGCTKDDGDDSSANPSDPGTFRTSCGTVYKGARQDSVARSEASKGTVRVLGNNLLIFTSATETKLLKLHNLGIISQDAKASAAKSRLNALAAQGEVFFYQASKDCSVQLESGGTGVLGQLFSAKGTNFSEDLILSGLASIEKDPCSGELLSSCYIALADATEETIADEVGEFLWKPVSDSNGRLAVHTGPSGTTVIVNGETGTNQGGGNGFGSLARFSKAGCAYGANVRVQVVNSEGAAYTLNGSTTITIPNGCNRYCIKNGAIALCPKS